MTPKRIKNGPPVAIIAIAMLFAVGPSEAATVEGAVYDRSGNMVPGVSVSIDLPGDGAEQSTYTNRDGRFVFFDVQPGTYIIEVYWGNELVYRRQHTVSEADRLDISL